MATLTMGLVFALLTAAQVGSDPLPPVPLVHLTAGTEVVVELVAPLSSVMSHTSDTFALRLAEPIMVDGKVVAPAGAAGGGEVIDSGPAGMGGRQGKLVLSARFLELNGKRVRIRGMNLAAAGKDRVNLATGVMVMPYISPAVLLIRGGNIELPAGTMGKAKLAEDVDLPLAETAIMDQPAAVGPH